MAQPIERWLSRYHGRAQPKKRKPLLPDEDKAPAWADDDLIGFSLYDGLRL